MFAMLFAAFAWVLVDAGETQSDQYRKKETAALSDIEARLWSCLRQYVEAELASGRNSSLWGRFADRQCIAIVAPQSIHTTLKSKGPEIAYSVGVLPIPGDLYAFYFPTEGQSAVTRAYSYALESWQKENPGSSETAGLKKLGPHRYACILVRVAGAEKIPKDAVVRIRWIENHPQWIAGNHEGSISWLSASDIAARRGQIPSDRELDEPRAQFPADAPRIAPLPPIARTPLDGVSKDLLQRIVSRHLYELKSDSSDLWTHLHRYAIRQVELRPNTLGFWVSLGDSKTTMTMRPAPLNLGYGPSEALTPVTTKYLLAAIVADGQVFLFGYPAGGSYEIDQIFEAHRRQATQRKDPLARAALSRLGELGPHGWCCIFTTIHEDKQRPVAKARWHDDGSAIALADQEGIEVVTISLSELDLAKHVGVIPNVERRPLPTPVERTPQKPPKDDATHVEPPPRSPDDVSTKVMLVVDWSNYLANADRVSQLIRELDHAISSLSTERQSIVSVSLASDNGLFPWPRDAIRAGRLPSNAPTPHLSNPVQSLKQAAQALANTNDARSIVFIVLNVEASATAPSATEIAALQSTIDAATRTRSNHTRSWIQVVQLGPGRADWLLRLAQSRNYNTVQFQLKSTPSLLIPDSAFSR